jgi:hypothetical protein
LIDVGTSANIGTTLQVASTSTLHGNVVADSGTASTSTTTGALVVAGGVGVSGNVFLGNAVTINSTQGSNQDVKVLGASDTTLVWARPNSTYDQVVIGGSATPTDLVQGAKLIINSTDSILLPVGSNAQRPGATGGNDTTGMMRFNTTLGTVEAYDGSHWLTFSTQFTVIADSQFTGDGTTTVFTLPAAQTTASCIISINGVVQVPSLAYSVGGTTLTFTEAPLAGEIIDVRSLTTTVTNAGLLSPNNNVGVTADNGGVYIQTGTSSTAITTTFNTSGAQVSSIAAVSVGTSATTIDTMSTSSYRSAKYVVQITNGSNYQVMEALLISDGTTATAVTYGVVSTGSNLGTLSATQSGATAQLQFTGASAGNQVRIKKDYIVV